MTTKEAYEVIVAYLFQRNHIDIFRQEYNPEVFGNFIIAFKEYESERSITCDRGQLYLCNSPDGNSDCIVIVFSLYEILESDLMEVLHNIK